MPLFCREDNKGGPERCKGTLIYEAPLENVKEAAIDLQEGAARINFNG